MFKSRKENKLKIKAVHDDFLETLLSSIGELDNIKKGNITCSICNNVIDLDNIGGIYPIENRVAIFCNNPNCLNEATMR